MVCRRNGVWGEDAEDFASLAKMKLVEDNYATIRKFRGECKFTTYLATVVTRHFLEYVRERRGRWRHSAQAERRGPLAKALEALVYRDRWRLAEAGEKLRTEWRTTASDAELARLLAELPERRPLRPTVENPDRLDEIQGSAQTDRGAIRDGAERLRAIVMDALARALDRLEPEDRMVVRMHYADGRKVVDVARALSLDPKRLHRRIPRLRALLRGYMEEAGVSEDDVREILGPEIVDEEETS